MCGALGTYLGVTLAIATGPVGLAAGAIFYAVGGAQHVVDRDIKLRNASRNLTLKQLMNFRTDFSQEDIDEENAKTAEEIKFPFLVRRAVNKAHRARDNIVFGTKPPAITNVAPYLAAQSKLGRRDQNFLYTFDLPLLVGTRIHDEDLVISEDLTSCHDGTYSTSVEFAAQYRKLVGDPAFERRLAWFQKEKSLEGTQPWYVDRPDYQSRLENIAEGDSF